MKNLRLELMRLNEELHWIDVSESGRERDEHMEKIQLKIHVLHIKILFLKAHKELNTETETVDKTKAA